MFASHSLFIGCHRNQVLWFSEADIKRDVRAGFFVGVGDGGRGELVDWVSKRPKCGGNFLAGPFRIRERRDGEDKKQTKQWRY